MSLILDALNRARRDADPVPGLDAGHRATEPGRSRVFKYLPWVALALAMIVIAWLLLQPARREPAPTAVAQLSRNFGEALASVKGELEERAAQAQKQPPAISDTATTGAAPSTGRQPAPQAADSSPALGKTAAPDTTAMAESATSGSGANELRQTVSEDNASRKTASAEVTQLYREAASRPPTPDSTPAATAPASAAASPGNGAKADAPGAGSGEEEPVDIEEILLRAKEEMNQGDLVEHPAPFLVDLSQRTKDEIPTIMYQRHNYGGDSSRSSVVLNGKTLRAGGNAASGVTVDEILSDSVILSFRGTQFRLRALNSWVNL